MKIVSIVGARPQFIKAAPISRALRQKHTEILVHTGQHYDQGMSAIFFEELQIPEPDYNLEIGSGTQGWQTGHMLIEIEKVLLQEKPDWVLVYGDTNSTLAGTLAAVKLHIPVAHVEAGLRSFNRQMPEEHNRVLTDHSADLRLCPTQSAVTWLAREGITQGVHWVGDVMYDAVLYNLQLAQQQSTILSRLDVTPQSYLLATVHRPYNVDKRDHLETILTTLGNLGEPVIWPVHPRAHKQIQAFELAQLAESLAPNLRLIEPVGYLDMLMLEKNARRILTDSGGVQKEAYFLAIPCVTLRPETEWVETVATGWNVLVGANSERIHWAVHKNQWPTHAPEPVFGNGHAAEAIVNLLNT